MKFLALIIFILVLFSGPVSEAATSLSVTPIIIDEKAKTRDILEESVTLTNNAARKLNVYAFVNNISAEQGKQDFSDPSRADLSSSLANWIAISRGVIELMPGEKRKIDFLIEVNLRAVPGMHHALISFAEGATRAEAENRMHQAAGVTVNVEVMEDIKERLQLKKFAPDKMFFSGFPASFSYILENIGNQNLLPSGEIRIYNRRGEEVASVKINDGVPIEQGATAEFVSNWQELEVPHTLASIGETVKGFGRYKALLDLEYGKDNKHIQDTVIFWIIPWQKILIVFGGLALLVGLAAYFTHHYYERRSQK